MLRGWKKLSAIQRVKFFQNRRIKNCGPKLKNLKAPLAIFEKIWTPVEDVLLQD